MPVHVIWGTGMKTVLQLPVKAGWGHPRSVLQLNVPCKQPSTCLRIPSLFSFLLQSLSLAFVGNGIITSNLLGFLLCSDMAILQLLWTWKAKCAGVIRFPSFPSMLGKTDAKSPDRAFLTQDYREDLVMWRACGTGLQGRNVLCSSMSLSSSVLAYRAVLQPCLSLLSSCAGLQVCWPNPDWRFWLVQGLSQAK